MLEKLDKKNLNRTVNFQLTRNGIKNKVKYFILNNMSYKHQVNFFIQNLVNL